MSSYESYDEDVARGYALERRPLGAEQITSWLAMEPTTGSCPLVLDAGCGTADYAVHVAEMSYLSLLGVDTSRAMLEEGRRKSICADVQQRVRLCQGDILNLPIPAGAVRAVLANQVLHHLESSSAANYPGHEAAIDEFARVLVPHGVLFLNFCTHDQLLGGFWYYDLIPSARTRALERGAPLSVVCTILEREGFEIVDVAVPHGDVMQGPQYFNPYGPFEDSWRKLDSIWSLVTPEELAMAQAELRTLIDSGQWESFMSSREKRRAACGQFTLLRARRGA